MCTQGNINQTGVGSSVFVANELFTYIYIKVYINIIYVLYRSNSSRSFDTAGPPKAKKQHITGRRLLEILPVTGWWNFLTQINSIKAKTSSFYRQTHFIMKNTKGLKSCQINLRYCTKAFILLKMYLTVLKGLFFTM